MLPKYSCLKKKKDFSEVFKKGRKIQGNFLYIKAISNNLKQSRFGIIISKKVAQKAVLRNKIKRRTRAVLKENLPRVKTNIDCVVFFLFLPKDFNLLKKDIEESFKKLKLYD